ncbi:MAG: response regulator [Verrucomicrobiota bacterium]
MQSQQPTVFLVDDEAAVLKIVSSRLRAAGFVVAGFAAAADFLASYNPAVPGCLVLDMAMPGVSGLDVQQQLAALGSEMPIIFFSGSADVPMCVQAMKHGAVDFLTKAAPSMDLVTAIGKALEHDRHARQRRAELDDIQSRIASLTPRERTVLAHLVTGKLNKQIAGDLGTAEKTIKVHRGRVLAKMRVVSIAELVRLVAKCGPSFPSVDGL